MDLFKEPIRYGAMVQLTEEKYPKIDKTEVIITDDGENVYVAAKSFYFDMSKEDNRIFVDRKQVGDYAIISKDEPIHKLLGALNTVLCNVSELLEKGKQGRLNESENL